MYTVHIYLKGTFFFQATIGIDFLSKTMYLEDRTVSLVGKHRTRTQIVIATCVIFVFLFNNWFML